MSSIDHNKIENLYKQLPNKYSEARRKLGHSLTLTEKFLFSHLALWPEEKPEALKTSLKLIPDRIAMQDATAQMALLQFMTTGRESVNVATSVHCDHLIRAAKGAEEDLPLACHENKEIYDFLQSVAAKYGFGFWSPGAGIIHHVIFEQYAFPGGFLVATDSHTATAGGLSMLGVGVGGSDAVDVLADQPLRLIYPSVIGVHLKGQLGSWTSAKDVILRLAEILSTKGANGKAIEYFGKGAGNISCTGKATICNLGAELGATTSVFPYDEKMSKYLSATLRQDVAKLADQKPELFTADKEVLDNPKKYYDQLIEIDLSKLEPAWVGPHSPDKRHTVSKIGAAIDKHDYPENIDYALIGSCANSSYEDLSRAASVARNARSRGLKTALPLMISPGSEQIYQTIKRDGFIDIFNDVGATVLANACGPCIGNWKRQKPTKGQKNTIVTSYNRNFQGRNDGNADTLAFIASPEIVTVAAFSGKLSFNPLKDAIEDNEGKAFILAEPKGFELPPDGFVNSTKGYIPPLADLKERKKIKIEIRRNSERLAHLKAFEAWDGKDFEGLPLLVKIGGVCTTDHISQAGPWLHYRGHLDNISNNLFLGALNAISGDTGRGFDVISGEKNKLLYEIARHYKSKKIGWVVVAEENYGEGSSREHAAMQARHLGCKAVIAKSFARMAESNLKRQGLLALYFKDQADYDLIAEIDKFSIVGLSELSPQGEVEVHVSSESETHVIQTRHTMAKEEIEWFKAGSALNTLRLSA